jgi:hypothetical protein
MHSSATQNSVLEKHRGLYHRHTEGFATLQIKNGQLDLPSVNAAPFGCGLTLDLTQFEPLNDWIKRGGMGSFEA